MSQSSLHVVVQSMLRYQKILWQLPIWMHDSSILKRRTMTNRLLSDARLFAISSLVACALPLLLSLTTKSLYPKLKFARAASHSSMFDVIDIDRNIPVEIWLDRGPGVATEMHRVSHGTTRFAGSTITRHSFGLPMPCMSYYCVYRLENEYLEPSISESIDRHISPFENTTNNDVSQYIMCLRLNDRNVPMSVNWTVLLQNIFIIYIVLKLARIGVSHFRIRVRRARVSCNVCNCGYPLDGIEKQNRCPECGTPFLSETSPVVNSLH
jgi:hypothetical protein